MTLLILGLIFTLAEGDAAASRSDWPEAARLYRAELESSPQSFDAKFKLARALGFAGKRAEAIALYTELLAMGDNSDVLLARGRMYAWEKRYAESEIDLLAATRKSPRSGDAWSALGDMYFWSDRPREAKAAYDQWAAVAPESLEARRAQAKVAESEIRRRQNPEASISEEYKWSASLGYGYTEFSPDRAEWHEGNLSVRRHWEKGSLAVEYLVADRFSRTDDAYALDAYVDLWPRAYANFRYQYSPDAALFPENAYRAEIWQGIGKGWEPSLSYDHMNFGNNGVDMYGVGLGKYVGNFYFRWKTLFIPATAKLGVSHKALARYYYAGNGDDYLEVNGGFGRGGEFVRRSNVVAATRSHGFGAAVQKYFHPQWGVKLTADYSDDEGSFVERSAGVSLQTRW